jgi:hypothetical protein
MVIKKPLAVGKRLLIDRITSYLSAFADGISTFPNDGGCCSFTGPFPPLLQISFIIFW